MCAWLLRRCVGGSGLVALGVLLAGCGGRIRDDAASESELDGADTGSERRDAPEDSEAVAPDLAPSPEEQPDCPAVPERAHPELELSFSCGIHRADVEEYSTPVASGEACTVPFGELNTFALELQGPGSDRYDAVVRCGYIRYDNGIVVGERVSVEARNGVWCHDLALESIDLVDRMLLTDVAFVLEPRTSSVVSQPLALDLRSASRGSAGVARVFATEPVCLYSAHRTYGAASCGEAAPSDTCVCHCGWLDFANEVTLEFAVPAE